MLFRRVDLLFGRKDWQGKQEKSQSWYKRKRKGKEFYATEIMIRILGFIKSAILVTSRWQKRRKDLKGSILICIYDLKERNHG